MENPTPPLADEQPVLADSESNDLRATETKTESAWLTVWWPGSKKTIANCKLQIANLQFAVAPTGAKLVS